MDADIRVIRLHRKTLEGKKDYRDWSKDDCWFVADYFDIMEVSTLSPGQPFAAWLDMQRSSMNEDEIAAQSYTLYCSPSMLEQYENVTAPKYRREPFTEEDGLGCLSVIHVYITPEILARMEDGPDEVRGDKGIILQPFAEDLYEALDIFSLAHPQDNFAARVYMMLSAGDFAIVVRSGKADTAYHLSTYLRKRRAGKANETDIGKTYVLYKTYTLSTIGRQIVRCEEGEEGTQNGFIVRGCYSNVFWKEQKKVQEFLGTLKKEIKEFYAISGRYDFTAHLTEDEFYRVMSAIAENGNNDKDNDDENDNDNVRYLRYLIRHNYLSYINERYLMEEPKAEQEFATQDVMSSYIFLRQDEENVQELFEQNKKQIEDLLKKQEEIANKSQEIKGYRKNIHQYLFLLRREISLCKSINELSDTRIYARVLTEQLTTVLKSAAEYISACSIREKNDAVIDMLEEHLRKAVVAVDSYAQYIRNNNLQSLQTPNYNIETSMSMEKVLIGYSELLWNFIEFYKQSMLSSTRNDYFPVMIPNLHDRDVNVDVLFPVDGLSSIDAGNGGNGKYLMVIGSPTLEEVTDFPIMIPALFHEAAHQFRYEERKDRNQAVLKATVKEIMNQAAKSIVNVIIEKIDVASDDAGRLCDGLTVSLTKAFLESKYPESDRDKLENKSLSEFEDELYDSINELFDVWTWKSNLEMRVHEFISEIRYEMAPLDEENRCFLIALQQLFEGEVQEDVDRIKEYAFYLAGACASRYLNEEKRDKWNQEKVSDESDKIWELKWDNVFGNSQDDDIQRISRAFALLVSWLDGEEEQLLDPMHFEEDEWKRRVKEANKFERTFYSSMKRYWDDYMGKSASVYSAEKNLRTDMIEVPAYHYWTRVGRYLGFDYDKDNCERFGKVFKEALRQHDLEIEPSILALYREETADLMMCNVMNMTPVGYLNLAVSLFAPRDGFYCGTDMERAFCVLYVQWCYVEGQDGNDAWKRYLQLCRVLYAEMMDVSQKALDRVESDSLARVHKPLHEEILKEDNVKAYHHAEIAITIYMEYLVGCCDIIKKEVFPQQSAESDHQKKSVMEEVLEELGNILRLYNLLIDLISNGKYYWTKLHGEKDLLDDLLKGKTKLSNFCTEARECDREGIKDIFEVGSLISKYLSRSYSQKGIGEDENLNLKCVELLLTMYYRNKIRIAQEEGVNADED